MRRVAFLLVLVLVLAVAAGCLYLAYGNFPVPSNTVEKVLPNDRFPQ